MQKTVKGIRELTILPCSINYARCELFGWKNKKLKMLHLPNSPQKLVPKWYFNIPGDLLFWEMCRNPGDASLGNQLLGRKFGKCSISHIKISQFTVYLFCKATQLYYRAAKEIAPARWDEGTSAGLQIDAQKNTSISQGPLWYSMPTNWYLRLRAVDIVLDKHPCTRAFIQWAQFL